MGYRFFRGGIEFSGDSPEMFAGVVRAKFYLPEGGQKIIDTLGDVLGAFVGLYDDDRRREGSVAWSHPGEIPLRGATREGGRICFVRTRIHDRWTLSVSSSRGLHPDAESVAKWAAEKLGAYLPKRKTDEPARPPSNRGGGSGGSAEVGIPVWWARKARS
jgi:hypothetical protein